jgi:polysaccharide biosynthesis protein PslH
LVCKDGHYPRCSINLKDTTNVLRVSRFTATIRIPNRLFDGAGNWPVVALISTSVSTSVRLIIGYGSILLPSLERTMSVRAEILFVSHTIPYPPFSGGTRRTLHILTELEKEFAVSLLPFWRRNHQRTKNDAKAAILALRNSVTRVSDGTAVPGEHSNLRNVGDHLRAMFRHRPYSWYKFDSQEYGARLDALLAESRFSMIHLDTIDLYRWLDRLPPIPIACTHHDVNSQLLRRRAEHTAGIAAHYLRQQAKRFLELEKTWAPRFSTNIMVSDLDAAELRSIAPQAPVAVVPNGVDVDYFRPSDTPPEPHSVVFVGPMYMFANRDAVDFLSVEALPAIRRRVPDVRIILIGKCPPDQRARLENVRGIQVLGQVPDLRPHLERATCVVVPIRVGGGTRLKILEAWAAGKAVISTSVGCEGLKAVADENILIHDDAEDFAEAVVRVLRDPELRARLQANGRATVEEYYSWSQVGGRIRNVYRKIMERASG